VIFAVQVGPRLLRGRSPSQVPLAWLPRRSPVILLMPGRSSEDYLEQNVAATGIQLSGKEYDELDSL
jgi:pyridoxine 4-dehydrogenase